MNVSGGPRFVISQESSFRSVTHKATASVGSPKTRLSAVDVRICLPTMSEKLTFICLVDRIVKSIKCGDAFQLVYTTDIVEQDVKVVKIIARNRVKEVELTSDKNWFKQQLSQLPCR